MKTIIRVAKTELKTLFYSPIAWFLIIIFLLQAGFTYIRALDSLASMQDSGAKLSFSFIGAIFYGGRGVFGVVIQNLYLYLPLLTMGLISRETSSGTIRLLYSSPIHMRDIVLGKFFAMMVINLMLVAIVAFFVVSGCFVIQSPDTGLLLSSLLGLFLLLCAFAAIGVFMSGLTNYQVVAAVCTFVAIWVLNSIGNLWQDIAFVRNLTYFLSMPGRTSKMMGGLITSKDLVYFVVIIYMFLGLTIYKLRAGMESKTAFVRAGRYLLVIFTTLLIGYISSIPRFVAYFDVTANKANTISPNAQKIISEMGDEPLEITSYTNLLSGFFYYGSPDSYNRILEKWEPYMRFKQHIKLNNVLYYDTLNRPESIFKYYPNKNLEQIAKQIAESKNMELADFKKPSEIRQIIDLSEEPDWYIMQLKYKGRTTFLRVFNDNRQWPDEPEVLAAFKRLLQSKFPRIVFVTGQYERDINKLGDREYRALTNFKSFRYSLLNQGFDVDTLSPDARPVPADIEVLVLADPRMQLTTTAIHHLQQYIDAGGNMMILGEPGKQALLNPFLAQFGVQLKDGILVQKSKDQRPDLVTPYLTDAAAALYPPLTHSSHDSATVSMPAATALEITDTVSYTIKPLLVTNAKKSWLKKGKLVTDSAAIEFMPQEGDIQASFATAVSLTRKVKEKEQRIIITGDADLMANIELQRFNMRTANFVFNTGMFSWLSYGEFPIARYEPAPRDTKVFVTKDQVKWIKVIYIYIIPAFLLAFGAILLIRRKRK